MFYDGLSRLLAANYSVGADYTYGYDVAGNLVNNNGVTRTYNAANQMTNDGTNTLTYDNNGNLTNDGVNSFTWDRANRMLTAPGSTSYKYDGASNRIQQTVSGVVTAYLNDVQPGLTQLLAETVSGNTTRYVQSVRGIHATESHAGVWSYFAQDGLGSVRGIVDDAAAVVSSQSFNPMGVPATDYGKGFGFTGEFTDANDLLYLRARYYAPSKGVFTALDPFEGRTCTPMSLNGYGWVQGNVPNMVDPSGMFPEDCALCKELLLPSMVANDNFANRYASYLACLNNCDTVCYAVPFILDTEVTPYDIIAIANEANIDPVFLAMTVDDEYGIQAQFPNASGFAASVTGRQGSHGIAQIQTRLAQEIVRNNPCILGEGVLLSDEDVTSKLKFDHIFSLHVAAHRLEELYEIISNDLMNQEPNDRPVRIGVGSDSSCSSEQDCHISYEELTKLVSMAYNQGWGDPESSGDVLDLLQVGPNPEVPTGRSGTLDWYLGIQNTLAVGGQPGRLERIWARQEAIETCLRRELNYQPR
jgi:RHS repeat-associated protein